MTPHVYQQLARQVLAYLTTVPAASLDIMAADTGWDRDVLVDVLRELDEGGSVILRNGWYRLSAAQRAGRVTPPTFGFSGEGVA
jgi:hypothetical protein